MEQPVIQSANTNIIGLLLYCLIVFGIIYFFIIRPNKKRISEYSKMIDSIKIGDTIVCSGIHGKVKKIEKDIIKLEIAKDVIITVNKSSISSIK